jgi:hypothetical protein
MEGFDVAKNRGGKTHRDQLLKMYSSRYAKHVWAFNQERCIYCGDIPTTIDHVPALVWMYCLGSERFKSQPVVTVPACARCNAWLGAKAYHTIRQRKGYIATRLREVFDRVMASPKWEDEEIEEMGFCLQTGIRTREAIREFGLRRIDWAQSTLPWDLDYAEDREKGSVTLVKKSG